MIRQRDVQWYNDVPEPRIVILDATQFAPAIPDGSAGISTDGDHIVVSVITAENSNFWSTAPLRYEFFGGNLAGTQADFGAPIDPLYDLSFQYLGVHATNDGDMRFYGYVYVVPAPQVSGEPQPLFWRPADAVGNSHTSAAIVGILNMVEVGPVDAATFDTPAPTQTIEAAGGGYTGLNGLWLLAANPVADAAVGDVTAVDWPGTPFGNPVGSVFAGDPGFLYGSTGATSGGDLEFAFAEVSDADLDDNPGTILGVWLQLLPMLSPDVVPLPDGGTVTVTNAFEATTTGLIGASYALPVSHAVNEFSADLVLPSVSTDWWAVLVDADGNTVARMPRAVIGDITETLNDIDTAQVTIPIRSTAGALIDAREVLPELEVQIWRGDVLWLWGPIVDAQPEGDHWRLEVRDCRWHLTRRHVGELGGSFGGKPPYFHDPMVNQRFESGDIAGWSILRTISVGEFVGFGTPDLGAIVTDPTRMMADGNPMVRCTAPEDPLDNYQLFQDLTIVPPQNRRPLRMTLSGWWYIPSDGGYAPNNQRMGLLLAPLVEDPSLPADYYRPVDVSFTMLDETTPQDTLLYQECTIEIPPGEPVEVHVSVCFPQGISYVGGIDVTVDDGLLYNESPTTIGPGLVMHAQDPAFSKSDVNLTWSANTIGDEIIREYVFRDHTNIGQAISTLAGEGWFDWFMTYSTTTRWATFTAPRRGGYRPTCRVRLNAQGRGNVERVERQRMWQSGATVVAAQTRSEGNHERAARSEHDLTLEEVFVAPREPKDFDLQGLADEHLAPAVAASVLQVSAKPGDERFLLGLQLGDTTDLLSSFPGHQATGVHRVVRRQVSPARDSVVLTMNPVA